MTPTYSPMLVAISYLIASLASYVALNFAAQMSQASKRAAHFWLVGGALAMGAGIWSMHFVGMLSFQLPIPTSYDLLETLLSLLIAVLSSGFALYTVNRSLLTRRRLLASGTLMGLGIASMHYTGMSAMPMLPPIQFNPWLLAASVAIAIAASVAALSMAFWLRSPSIARALPKRVAGALVMGLGITGMHYTGMTAATFDPASVCLAAPLQINDVWLAAVIACCTVLLLAGTTLIRSGEPSTQAGEHRSAGIRIKLASAFMLAAALVAAFVVASLFLFIEGAERAATLEAEHVAIAMAHASRENALADPVRAQRYVTRIYTQEKRDVFIVDSAKRIIADANPGDVGETYAGDMNDAVGQTLIDGRGRTFEELLQDPPRMARQFVAALHAKPEDLKSPIIGALILEYTYAHDKLVEQARAMTYVFAAIGVAVVFLVAMLGLRVAAMIVPPLQTLKRGADSLASGNYDARVEVRSNDEIGTLAASFNRMATDLEAKHVELVEYQQRLEDRVAARTAELQYAEKAQRQLATELRLITEHMPVALCYVDSDLRFHHHNRRYAEITGLSDDRIDGQKLNEIVAPELYALIEGPIAKVLMTGQEIVYQRPKGSADESGHVQTTLVPRVRDDGVVVGFYTMVQDISEQKRAEAGLKKSNDELRELNRKLQQAHTQLLQAEKMASIGQLASGVAHEINNPVGYVSSNLGTLGGYLDDMFALLERYQKASRKIADEHVRAELRAADEAADVAFVKDDIMTLLAESNEGLTRVKRIVQDLKNFSRSAGDESWQWADLHQGIDSTLNIVWNELKYKAEVSKHYGDLPQVQCRPSQLNQVFMNMLVNGADAIERHGTIDLRSGVEGGSVWIEFEDTGAGIAPEHLDRIFDPFFTTKEVGKGTGLGLALSYGIVQDHGGRIEVRSEVGKGTAFRVWLPIHGPEGAQAAGATEPRQGQCVS